MKNKVKRMVFGMVIFIIIIIIILAIGTIFRPNGKKKIITLVDNFHEKLSQANTKLSTFFR